MNLCKIIGGLFFAPPRLPKVFRGAALLGAAAWCSLAPASFAHSRVILNEYNAVRADRHLDSNEFGGSTQADTHFSRIAGNGGRWFELLVVGETELEGETVDMRGWKFDWQDADGSGSFTLSNAPLLANVHRGTILTFFSQDVVGQPNVPAGGGPNVATNAAAGYVPANEFDPAARYNPYEGSWWLNINLTDSQYIASGSLRTSHDDWQLTVRDASNAAVFNGGEGIGFLTGEFSRGINSNEVAKFEAYMADAPDVIIFENTFENWQSITGLHGDYMDGTSSSFGSENVWSGGSGIQDLTILRNPGVIPEPGGLALLGMGTLGLLGLRRRGKRNP